MYIESRNIYRLNLEDFTLSRCAESWWSTCIKVVKCSGIAGEEATKLLISNEMVFARIQESLRSFLEAIYRIY